MKPESFPLLPLILVLSHNVSARPPLDDLGTEPQHRSVRRRAPNDYGYDDSYYYDRNCDYDYYDEYDRGYNPPVNLRTTWHRGEDENDDGSNASGSENSGPTESDYVDVEITLYGDWDTSCGQLSTQSTVKWECSGILPGDCCYAPDRYSDTNNLYSAKVTDLPTENTFDFFGGRIADACGEVMTDWTNRGQGRDSRCLSMSIPQPDPAEGVDYFHGGASYGDSFPSKRDVSQTSPLRRDAAIQSNATVNSHKQPCARRALGTAYAQDDSGTAWALPFKSQPRMADYEKLPTPANESQRIAKMKDFGARPFPNMTMALSQMRREARQSNMRKRQARQARVGKAKDAPPARS